LDALQARAEKLSKTTFVGGPVKQFSSVGRMQLEMLLHEGLWPQARVLDVGCGCLRGGYWLMHFLDPACYFGIEPNAEMLQAGLAVIVEPETVTRADAHFSHNDAFDFSEFGVPFDFVLARSVWTHASDGQIGAMLDSFLATSPAGVFLTSYRPADLLPALPARFPALARRLPTTSGSDADEWIGRSHRSKEAGIVRHSFGTLAAACERRGLAIRQLDYGVANRQRWLRIEK
jgi:SAM-dependent methyltransferase